MQSICLRSNQLNKFIHLLKRRRRMKDKNHDLESKPFVLSQKEKLFQRVQISSRHVHTAHASSDDDTENTWSHFSHAFGRSVESWRVKCVPRTARKVRTFKWKWINIQQSRSPCGFPLALAQDGWAWPSTVFAKIVRKEVNCYHYYSFETCHLPFVLQFEYRIGRHTRSHCVCSQCCPKLLPKVFLCFMFLWW